MITLQMRFTKSKVILIWYFNYLQFICMALPQLKNTEKLCHRSGQENMKDFLKRYKCLTKCVKWNQNGFFLS